MFQFYFLFKDESFFEPVINLTVFLVYLLNLAYLSFEPS